jgi:hypothetical protein
VSRALHMLGQRLQMSPQAARQTRFGVLCSTSLARLCCSTSGRGSSRSPLRCTLALRRSAFCTPQLLLRCARCACRCCALSAQRLCRARCVFARDFSVCLCATWLARLRASTGMRACCSAGLRSPLCTAQHCSALLSTALTRAAFGHSCVFGAAADACGHAASPSVRATPTRSATRSRTPSS